jgi:uncharacterized membrane protein YcaP (DUF421 family)
MESGMFHIVIDQGTINQNSLASLNIDTEWIEKAVSGNGYKISDISLMLVDESMHIQIYTQKEKHNENILR